MSIHTEETQKDSQRINSARMKKLEYRVNLNSLTCCPSKQNLKSEIIKAPSKPSIHQQGSPTEAHKGLVKHHKVKPQIRSEQISANQMREKMVKSEMVQDYNRMHEQSVASTFYGGTSEWKSPSFQKTEPLAATKDMGKTLNVQINSSNTHKISNAIESATASNS